MDFGQNFPPSDARTAIFLVLCFVGVALLKFVSWLMPKTASFFFDAVKIKLISLIKDCMREEQKSTQDAMEKIQHDLRNLRSEKEAVLLRVLEASERLEQKLNEKK